VVMSMLDREYQARVALDQEGSVTESQERAAHPPDGDTR